MRVLFAFAGARGHAEPMVPLARAARAVGHSVAFTGKPVIVPALAELGFAAFPTGLDTNDASTARTPLQPFDAEREDRVLREGFAGRIARRRATDLLALAAGWRPDLIVRDEFDFAGAIVAERLALPYATVLVDASGAFLRTDVVGPMLHALRSEHGLPPDPELEMLSRHLVLSPFPPSLRHPRFPLPATAHGYRAAEAGPLGQPEGATVYFTLGTVFNVESGDLYARVLEGLLQLPVGVVMTVGSRIDPVELGPLPGRVRVERFVPQDEVLPRCSAVVSHAGSGTVLGALAHGLPSVLLPIGADQPGTAARCAELEAAVVLDPITATPEDVREAVAMILAEPGYRAAAGRLRDEIAGLPEPEEAVTLLERLTS